MSEAFPCDSFSAVCFEDRTFVLTSAFRLKRYCPSGRRRGESRNQCLEVVTYVPNAPGSNVNQVREQLSRGLERHEPGASLCPARSVSTVPARMRKICAVCRVQRMLCRAAVSATPQWQIYGALDRLNCAIPVRSGVRSIEENGHRDALSHSKLPSRHANRWPPRRASS